MATTGLENYLLALWSRLGRGKRVVTGMSIDKSEGPNLGTISLWPAMPISLSPCWLVRAGGAKDFAFAPPVGWTLTKRLFEAFAQM